MSCIGTPQNVSLYEMQGTTLTSQLELCVHSLVGFRLWIFDAFCTWWMLCELIEL